MSARKKPKKPPGRPSQGRSTEIKVRVTPEEKAAWEAAAKDAGLTLSDYIRLTLRKARH